ncbi:MAG: 4a-hydroxytetrahydrobiopterin dehydratase [Candidatus Paceibacterota bacterium]|jgi:4a-hydroxytetrahydrobiopterin dehydratase
MSNEKEKNLLNKKCVPCEGGALPLDKEEAEKYMHMVSGWELSEDGKEIIKKYKFQDFIGAINFVNHVAEIAEAEGHHPDIKIKYNKVKLILSTHAIGGLSENDFILAAKVDASK